MFALRAWSEHEREGRTPQMKAARVVVFLQQGAIMYPELR